MTTKSNNNNKESSTSSSLSPTSYLTSSGKDEVGYGR